MVPTPDQIRDAAYDYWQRRGGVHGRDRDDWLRAEQDLLFTLNYTVVTRIGPEPRVEPGGNGLAQGSEKRRQVCRFCEQSAPHAHFPRVTGTGSLASFRADGTLSIPDECEECRHFFEEHIAGDLARFLGSFPGGWAPGEPLPALGASRSYVPIAAFKGLTRMALACLPRAELSSFEDAIEWISNPDHAFDSRASGPLACDLHFFDTPFASPTATLSLRHADGEPMPYALFHFGHDRLLFQVAVPLCGGDDEFDGLDRVIPVAAPAIVTGRLDAPTASATVSLSSPKAARETRVRPR